MSAQASPKATEVWRDAEGMPDALAATLDRADGFDDVAALLARARRVVATGNGASYYVALALWLASLEGERAPVEVVAVPGGLVARGAFRWREGDVLLAISSSGELRDVIEAVDAGAPRPFALVTANPDSTLGRQAAARAVVTVDRQESLTHTQVYCGALVAALDAWARVTGDAGLRAACAAAPGLVASALARAVELGHGVPRGGIVLGSGPAWAAALESALLLKEVAILPFEGLETREGATSGMFALGEEMLAVGLGGDPLLGEALEVCAARGARTFVLEAPGDRRIAPVTTFVPALGLALELARRAGRDPDRPQWADAYEATVRVKPRSAPPPR